MIVHRVSNSPIILDGCSNVCSTHSLNLFGLKFNNKPNVDTVSFTGYKTKNIIDEAVSEVFRKLYSVKPSGVFRKYQGVNKNNITVLIQETSFDRNNAVLALTNGKFDNKSYAVFELRKVAGNSHSSIISLQNNKVKNDIKTAKMIKTIFRNL